MTHDDDLLGELGHVWRSEEPPAISRLRQRVRRSARLNRLVMLVEATIGLGGVAAGVWLVVAGSWLLGAAAGAFGAFGLAVSLVTRRSPAQTDLQSVSGAVAAAVQQAHRQHRAALGGLWVCVGALLFLVVVVLDTALGSEVTSEELSRLVRLQSAGVLAVAIAMAMAILGLLRAERRLRHLATLREQL